MIVYNPATNEAAERLCAFIASRPDRAPDATQ
jgi:hypothetical protein